jgi:glutaredoxin 3
MEIKPVLYIKEGCPWCSEALSFFGDLGITLEMKDVNQNIQDMHRLIEVSGQSLTPTFVFGDFVVADFSIDEFQEQLNQAPEIKKRLGI